MTEIRRRHEKPPRRSIGNNGIPQPKKRKNVQKSTQTKVLLFITIVSGALYAYYQLNSLLGFGSQNDALKKSDLPDALVDDIYNETSWSTLRPHLYFGLKTKHPESPLFGLLWYKQPQEQFIQRLPIRHWCEHGDDVKFHWTAHDGRTFGRQQIQDDGLRIQTDWMGVGQRSWAARLKGSGNSSHALVFYLALQGLWSRISTQNQMPDSVYSLVGSSLQLGQFTMQIRSALPLEEATTISSVAYSIPPQLDMRHVNELVMASLTRPEPGQMELSLRQNEQIPGEQSSGNGANFAAVQISVQGNFDLELEFLSDGDEPLETFEPLFAQKLKEFDAKFTAAFPMDFQNAPFQQKSEELRRMGKAALASLLGGIGVWHGHSLVRTGEHEEAKPFGPLSLFSAVPSRPFFPRGFLWDEGFHNLLIRQFDPRLSLQIIASWLDAMNAQGWIPREMILGEEAQAKVPVEFLVQSPAVANPPMFFYVLEKFVKNPELLKQNYQQIARLYPRLKQFYIWLRSTQQGPRPGTMQWQGRNRTTDRELNPKILPSGLDDFPRATHPSPEEYHLDLRCWIALSSRVLRQLAETFGDSDWVPTVEEDVRLFNDQDGLDRLHWSEQRQQYADFGLHSERVKLAEVLVKSKDKRGAQGQPPQQEKVFVRITQEEPKLRLVDYVFGYVNLFPLLLRLLPSNSPKLGILLRSLNNSEHLWTPYGLRSLSTKSLYYLARNTEHDPPYWRGPIWINVIFHQFLKLNFQVNYLALDALRHYAHSGGPHARLAAELYDQLRTNVITNIAEQYAKTGFFWEHYNDRTGEGMGTRPFTGWTALVLNIMAESFD